MAPSVSRLHRVLGVPAPQCGTCSPAAGVATAGRRPHRAASGSCSRRLAKAPPRPSPGPPTPRRSYFGRAAAPWVPGDRRGRPEHGLACSRDGLGSAPRSSSSRPTLSGGLHPAGGRRGQADIARFANGSRLAMLRGPCPGHPPVRLQHPGARPASSLRHRQSPDRFPPAASERRSATSPPWQLPGPACTPSRGRGKRAEGKRHNAAVICLARRRCDVILAMLRSRTVSGEGPARPAGRRLMASTQLASGARGPHHLDVDGQRLCPLNGSAKMSVWLVADGR